MTYQAPAFMVAHPAASLPISAISVRKADTFSDDSKRALVDSRQGELSSYTATGIEAGVVYSWDGLTAPRINRSIVPAGHLYDGFTIEIFSDDDVPNFPSPTLRETHSQIGSGIIDTAMSLVTTDLDWLIRALDSVNNDVFTLSEWWIGERKALTTNDGRVSQGFERSFEHDVAEDEFGGRTTSLELAPARRKFSLRIRDLDPTATDFATLDEVIRNGRARPFWYWTPDTTDTGPYLVKLTAAASRVQTSDIPTTIIRYEVQLEMLEQLT